MNAIHLKCWPYPGLTIMVQNRVHSPHQILLDIVEGNTLCCAVVFPPLDIDAIIRVPIIFRLK